MSDLQRGEKIQAAKFNIDGKAEVSSIDIGLLLSLILRNSEKKWYTHTIYECNR